MDAHVVVALVYPYCDLPRRALLRRATAASLAHTRVDVGLETRFFFTARRILRAWRAAFRAPRRCNSWRRRRVRGDDTPVMGFL